ncbi:unnamed protein product [Closterium sp. NIES-64]|nr:unnamed protein product [Closterium sp. NIES-64]
MAPRPPPKERAPLLPKSAVVTDAASMPAGKGKKVDDNEPVTPVAGSSGLSLEEKLAALALANDNGLDDEFSDDDSDTELEFEVSKDSTATLHSSSSVSPAIIPFFYTALLPLPVILVIVRFYIRSRVKRHSFGFFHPFTNDGGGGERVLWCAVRAIQVVRLSYPI